MCNGGRIRHHLKHNLWKRNAHVVIVGFQARNTPGRALVDGGKTFRVVGEEISVKASIYTLGGFSAHASQSQLLEWISHFEKPHPKLYLVHGEDDAKHVLQTKLAEHGWSSNISTLNEAITF